VIPLKISNGFFLSFHACRECFFRIDVRLAKIKNSDFVEGILNHYTPAREQKDGDQLLCGVATLRSDLYIDIYSDVIYARQNVK